MGCLFILFNPFIMKISVITACRNSEKFIKNTILSVLSQDYKDYEYIIVDGVSTDHTLSIIQHYEPLFQGRLHYISEPDHGLYEAMNKGVALATGEIIGLLNSDDFFAETNILSTVARTFAHDETLDALYGDVIYVDRDNIQRPVRYYSSRVFRPSLMPLGFMPAHPSFYCRKSVYDSLQLTDSNSPVPIYYDPVYRVAADFEFLLRAIYCHHFRMQYLPKVFVMMRNGGYSSKMNAHLKIDQEHHAAFKRNHVPSSYLLIPLRYLYKVSELIWGKWLIKKYFKEHDFPFPAKSSTIVDSSPS